MSILYAVSTAILRGFSAIPTRKGLEKSNANTSVVISLLVTVILQWAIVFLIYPPEKIFAPGLGFFIVSGFFAPGTARIFRDMGFKKLGVSITYPIVSTSTFFSIIFASIFLKEKITIYIILGALLIFTGLNFLTGYRNRTSEWRKRDMVIPFIAALLYASSTNLRKMGLTNHYPPILGAAITSTVSFLVIIVSTVLESTRKKSWNIELNAYSLKFFLIASIGSSTAFLLYFMALSGSELIKIQPITSINPLFAMIFSYFFLKDEEKISRRIVLGSFLIVLGLVLVAV
jgi:transporter family protein